MYYEDRDKKNGDGFRIIALTAAVCGAAGITGLFINLII